jgi:hypothetical protein
MDAVVESFEHAVVFKILICKTCRSGVTLDMMSQHLQERNHCHLSPTVRQTMVEIIRKTYNLADTSYDLVYPVSPINPISFLHVYSNGMQCQFAIDRGRECGHITLTTEDRETHFRQAHEWLYPGSEHDKSMSWTSYRSNIYCQQLSSRAGLQRLFPVYGIATVENHGMIHKI